MALLDKNGISRRGSTRGKTPKYASMPRSGRVIIDPAKVRYYRHTLIMTREQLAQAARCSVYSITAYEQGIRFPRESSFRRLVTALGVTPEDLLFDDCRYIRKDEEGD